MSSFSAVFGWAFLVVFSIDHVSFLKPHDLDSSSYSLMAVARQTTVGRRIVVNHNTIRLCKHSLRFIRCHFCVYQSAIGDELESEKLVCAYMVYYHVCGLHRLMVCGSGDFCQSRLNIKAQVQFSFSIKCSHECGNLYTCLVHLLLFLGWRKNRYVKYFTDFSIKKCEAKLSKY